MIGFKTNGCKKKKRKEKNRKKVDFYNHVGATTPQDRSSRCRI